MPESFRDGRLSSGDDPALEPRLGVLAACIVVVFLIFFLRLFQLQIVEGADLRRRSERNFVRTVRLEAPRGDIVDRRGRVLATTRPAYAVQVIPNELREADRTYRVLAALLQEDPVEIRDQVGHPRGRARFQPVVLDGDMDYLELVGVESYRYAMPGVVIDILPRREYVHAASAAHLLGTIGQIEQSQLATPRFADYRGGDIVGQSGLEALYEEHLRGRAGGRNLVVDVAGREVEVLDEVPAIPGGRLVLALDLDLQLAAEAAFDSHSAEEPDKMGALVALDPRNGDVLALVSRPAYDPNDFAGGIDPKTWVGLRDHRWEPLRNRALSGHYPPGSTYKALVALAGLEEGVITPESDAYCPGHYRLGRRVYRCWKRGGHGTINLRQSLVHSCDVFYYQLGQELGIDKIAEFAQGFGLGTPTGIALRGEKSGLVPTKAWKERARREPWLKGETVSASIGQGFNLTTPIQLAVLYGAIANGGTLVEPRLVKRFETWRGQLVREQPEGATRQAPVSQESLAIVRDALHGVVADKRGTGARARVKGMSVAGKTGTTQVVSLEVVEGMEDDEIPIRYRDHAWFAAFAPVEDPQIVVAVLVEHGGGGGANAAPIAQRVLQKFAETRGLVPAPPESKLVATRATGASRALD